MNQPNLSFSDAGINEVFQDPEQILWQAVVLQGFRDACGIGTGYGAAKARVAAQKLIEDRTEDYLTVCELAGMDPDFYRDAYLENRIDTTELNPKKVRENVEA